MRATVKLKQAERGLWRISVVRGEQITASVVRDWERASALTWRAVALLAHWDTLLEREPAVPGQGRYVVVGAGYPSEDPPLPGGHEGQVLAAFRSFDAAVTFADQELCSGNSDVVVIDRELGRRVFPRERVDSSIRPSTPPPDEVVTV